MLGKKKKEKKNENFQNFLNRIKLETTGPHISKLQKIKTQIRLAQAYLVSNPESKEKGLFMDYILKKQKLEKRYTEAFAEKHEKKVAEVTESTLTKEIDDLRGRIKEITNSLPTKVMPSQSEDRNPTEISPNAQTNTGVYDDLPELLNPDGSIVESDDELPKLSALESAPAPEIPVCFSLNVPVEEKMTSEPTEKSKPPLERKEIATNRCKDSFFQGKISSGRDLRTLAEKPLEEGLGEIELFLNKNPPLSLINEKGKDTGETALHKAAKSGNIKTMQALLDAGADPTLLDNKGKTAWDLLQQYLENLLKNIQGHTQRNENLNKLLVALHKIGGRESLLLRNHEPKIAELVQKILPSIEKCITSIDNGKSKQAVNSLFKLFLSSTTLKHILFKLKLRDPKKMVDEIKCFCMIFSDPNSDMSKKIEKPTMEKLSQILEQLEVAEKENPSDLSAQIHKIEGEFNALLVKEISKLSQATTPYHKDESSFVLDSM